jgi:hypothetical protein
VKALAALILSSDAVAAALVGSIAEFTGLVAQFPFDGERPRDALRRLRPATVLADCNQDPNADAFVGPAMMCGARVGLFCSSSNAAAAGRSRQIAERYDVAFFLLPEDVDALRAYLHEVAGVSRNDTGA